jgi:Tfp pilus assembly protein PilF
MRFFLCSVFVALITLCAGLSGCGGEAPATTANITNIDSLFKMYPDSLEVIIRHGNTMLDRYDYNSALKDGAKAYRMSPENLEARLLYALALNNRASRTATDVASAQEHFHFVLKKEPKNLKAIVALATTYTYQGDYERSFRYINEALRIDKRYRDAYVLKGTNYLQLDNRELAKSSYRTAIEQDPDFFEAYIFLGSLYEQDKDPIALEYYKSAVQLKPNSMDALYALAYGFQNFNKNAEAQRVYRKMAKLEPEFATSYFQQGYIKQFLTDPPQIDSAMYFYEIAVEKEPRFVEAWHNMGLCYINKGEKTKALQCFKKAVKYDPTFEKARIEAEQLSGE